MNFPIPARQDMPGPGSLREGAERAGTAAPAGNPSPSSLPVQLPDFVPVAAVEAILAERYRQIHTFGHTPEDDRRRPVMHQVDIAARYWRALREDVSCGGSREAMIVHATKCAAALAALLDRLLAEATEQACQGD